MEIQEAQYDPKQVASIVRQALDERKTLSVSFLETDMYERLSFLLSKYIPKADISMMISDLKEHFFNGYTKLNPQELYSIIHNCKKCPANLVTHPGNISVWNTNDPDLMLVIDSPEVLQQYGNKLAHHLKMAGFTSSRCVLTFLVRCNSNKTDETILKNCLPYLHTEMALLNPKLIIPIGANAFKAVTGDDTEQLTKIRGTVRWFGPFAILPEASYAWAYHRNLEEDAIAQHYVSSFKTAYQFIYGQDAV